MTKSHCVSIMFVRDIRDRSRARNKGSLNQSSPDASRDGHGVQPPNHILHGFSRGKAVLKAR